MLWAPGSPIHLTPGYSTLPKSKQNPGKTELCALVQGPLLPSFPKPNQHLPFKGDSPNSGNPAS